MIIEQWKVKIGRGYLKIEEGKVKIKSCGENGKRNCENRTVESENNRGISDNRTKEKENSMVFFKIVVEFIERSVEVRNKMK
ncbi:hypothetical protein M3181_11760 [Mesobacillus maritimus]|uniref:hypothetical protein n=1 Tax=Mesobacillus maritimus TaxID=1643336 RepID=UPI0020408660|nr:hypothetical protein [Mesobacillus maritimus]MCM3669671.1 hypothetical protein [Mesobacillus maritimus]